MRRELRWTMRPPTAWPEPAQDAWRERIALMQEGAQLDAREAERLATQAERARHRGEPWP